ncbi:MAG TPA: MMPL family transporter [Micromonosporaceae bacterium]|nr:MMPL family transporter [Micromonosporaceae bacterium]
MTGAERHTALQRVARFCYRRRRFVLLMWVLGTIAVLVLGITYAAAADNDFAGGSSDSGRAQAILADHFPSSNGSSLTVAVRADQGVNAATVRSRVDPLLAYAASLPNITGVASPYDRPGQVSADGRTAFATVQSDQPQVPTADIKNLISRSRAASGSGITFAVGGPDVVSVDTPYGGASDGIGGVAAMIVILIAFGSLLAMGLTMAAAVFGIASGLALIFLIGHLIPAPSFSPIVSTLLGLGVGIDYALLIVTRYREQLATGAEPEDATVTALATAGRSVLFAGATVIVAMLGLFVMAQPLLNATAVAACVTVAATMASALTLLPALLGFAGRNIDRLRLPYLGRTAARSPVAERWARAIQRRPVTGLVLGALLMLILAAPALSMRLSFEDNTTEPHNTSGYTAQKILADGFGPGFNAPLIIAATVPSGESLDQVARAVHATPGVAAVTPVQRSSDGEAALFIAYPRTAIHDVATTNLLHRLRDDVIPAAVAGTGVVVHVGGPNAGTVDFADAVGVRLPWLITVVIGLSLILFVILVRSVTIALKAALMTLLSTGAAYGVLTAIVQWGWLGHQLGFPEPTPITTWVPLFIFPILFGLSTDYEVFLISRIREEYDAGADTREAVARGLAHTARIITAAAAIMVTVFLSVLATPEIAVKQFGLGLGIAVLLDATVVRMVLVPSLMELLGAANWWLPKPVARVLPRVAETGLSAG